MKRDCSTCICKEGSCYPSTTIFDKDKTCKSYTTDYESYITDLEKENAELKKNYEDSLVACGVLKNKVELLSQPSPLESMQDTLITAQKVQNEKRKAQLTKAKEIIKELNEGLDKLYLSGLSAKQIAFIEQLQDKAEQFISEVEK